MKWKVEQHSRSSLLLMNLIDLPLVDLNLLNLGPLESERVSKTNMWCCIQLGLLAVGQSWYFFGYCGMVALWASEVIPAALQQKGQWEVVELTIRQLPLGNTNCKHSHAILMVWSFSHTPCRYAGTEWNQLPQVCTWKYGHYMLVPTLFFTWKLGWYRHLLYSQIIHSGYLRALCDNILLLKYLSALCPLPQIPTWLKPGFKMSPFTNPKGVLGCLPFVPCKGSTKNNGL